MPDSTSPDKLAKALGYNFKRPELFTHALVHRSAPNEHAKEHPESNERLEFLGDAVLDMIIARELYVRFPDDAEGTLTRYKSALVNESGLAEIARQIDLGAYLILGHGEEESGGRDKPSLLSDALEAILGAIYLDGGTDAVDPVILKLFHQSLATVESRTAPRGDYKTALQEWTQANGLGLPAYRLLGKTGPDHARTYAVAVSLGDDTLAEGAGKSKREAERLAAQGALEKLTGSQG